MPGGFATGIDLLELNGPEDDAKVFERAGQLWTRGQRIYLSGGSDAHDVWVDESGQARAYVHVPGSLTAEGFVANLKNGHAYVTRGPLIMPSVMFGSDLRAQPGEPLGLSFDLTAANGLAKATLVGPQGEIESRSLDAAPQTGTVEFETVMPEANGQDAQWIALVVEDAEGKMAFTNPIWLKPLTQADLLPSR